MIASHLACFTNQLPSPGAFGGDTRGARISRIWSIRFGVVALLLFSSLASAQSANDGNEYSEATTTAATQDTPGVSADIISVAMDGQTPAELTEAQRVALRIYLLRNTSNPTILGSQQIRQALQDPQPYVLQSQLRLVDSAPTGPRTSRAQSTGGVTHVLDVTPDARAIHTLLLQLGSTGAADADTAIAHTGALIWMIIQDGEKVVVVGGNRGERLMTRMQELAAGQALELVFPNNADAAIEGQVLATMTPQQLVQVSAPYQREQILRALLVRMSNGGWQARWEMLSDTRLPTFADTSENLDRALSNGVSWLGGQAGDLDAAVASPVQTLAFKGSGASLWLGGIDPNSYQQTMSALSTLDWLDTVSLNELTAQGARIMVTPASAATRVAEYLVGRGWYTRTGAGGAVEADIVLVSTQ